MSNTRRTTDAGKFRQERFASSQEFDRGLMANLVAKRAALLDSSDERELIWFLQYLSHQPGGIKKFAVDLLVQFPERVATPSMQKLGFKPGRIYSTDEVKTVREEVSGGQYPLKGESDYGRDPFEMLVFNEDYYERCKHDEAKARLYSAEYPASDFTNLCQQAAAGKLEKYLSELCVAPAMPVADGSPWYFPNLFSTLRQVQAEWNIEKKPLAVTTIGHLVCDALEYAREEKILVLIDGLARTGKTFSARAWCDQNPGFARYVQVPSTNDDFSFFRAIAMSLGVSVNLKSKAQELRSRIEDTLQCGHLMLVLDEAHYLWPQSNYRDTTPGRVNWLMTALVNHGVPVGLVTTPQFFRSQKQIEAKTCWTSEQFTGRIGYYEKLPDILTEKDFEAVAKALIPSGDARSIEALVLYANISAKNLAAIKAVIDRASFVARKQGRDSVALGDIQRAIKGSVIPSDTAFSAAMQGAQKPSRRALNVPASVPAQTLQPDFRRPEKSLQTPDLMRSRSVDRDTGAELVH
jgi:hypothetical protein